MRTSSAAYAIREAMTVLDDSADAPSAILRQRDHTERAAAMDAFVTDRESVARWLAEDKSS
ncbi:MAG: hypothetical protein ACXVSA_23350 [Solirubrobacteraceae bacterium]